MNNLLKILKNKVFLYMGSRYLTYGIQFCTTLIVAIMLGPVDFGVWSFFLLIINFFNIVDFGIANSLNVLLVQEKEDNKRCSRFISAASLIILSFGFLILVALVVVKHCQISLFDKYRVWGYLPIIYFIVLFAYFNKTFSSVYRVGNRLLEVAVYQSLIPFLLFFVIILFQAKALWFMVCSYLIGNVIIFVFFLTRGLISVRVKPHFDDVRVLFKKGFWLFLYNSAFYLVMYFTLLFVSKYYLVEEYGKFNFAHTLSNSIFLLVDAFGFIIFPKMIDRLKSADYSLCKSAIEYIRTNYITIIYSLVFFALPFFEFFCSIIPKYSDCGRALCVSAISLLPYSNAFGLNTFLIAQNNEKILSIVSICILIINVGLLFIFKSFFVLPYDYLFFFPAISYVLYTSACAFLCNAKMGEGKNFTKFLSLAFPLRPTISFLVSLFCIFFSYKFDVILLLFVPAVTYIFTNRDEIGVVFKTMISVINRPNIVDL